MTMPIHDMPEQIIRERMIRDHDAADGAPTFAHDWAEIRKDLDGMAAGALRIGKRLIVIRDALKPRKLWLKELKEQGWSQPQASRYIRFAELPEQDRDLYLRCENFSLSAAVGEPRRTKKCAATGADVPGDISSSERGERLSAIEERFKLVLRLVEAGERVLVDDPQPEYVDDPAGWQGKVAAAAAFALDVLHAVGREELQKQQRLLGGE